MQNFCLDFVAVGPQRTGSTWLYQLLKQHPDICFPKDVKETMFFDKHYQKGIYWYAEYFQNLHKNQRCGEVAPTYFDVDTVPARIHQINSQCKIIINLRNPLNRTLSLYRHHLSKGRIKGSFQEATTKMPRIIESGKYSLHIPKWLDKFGIEQVKFILLEDVESHPEIVIKSICKFLGLAEINLPDRRHQKVNSTTIPRFPWLAKAAAQLTTTLHANRMHKVVAFGKKLGLKTVYTGGEKRMPEIRNNDFFDLLNEYETDILFVENLLKKDLSIWRKG